MATQPNLISDISTLTRVPNKVLTELAHKSNLCIGNIISDAKDAGEQAVIINNAQQTATFNSMLNSYTAPIAAAVNTLQTEVASVKCRLPETVTLPYSCATAVPTNALYNGWSFTPNVYGAGYCNNSLWG